MIFESAGNLGSAAAVQVSGGTAGVGGRVIAVAGGDADISGAWTTGGSRSSFSVGELVLEACHVRIAAPLVNAASAGRNRITARESVTITANGSLVASGELAGNDFVVRTADKPPRLYGTVAPVASVVIDSSLAGCPVCGNAEVDAGETCDDGNPDGGDGCSSRCQDEGATGGCIHEAVAGACDDHDFCSTDETCRDGTCRGTSTRSLAVSSLRIRAARRGKGENAAWKATMPASLLTVAPPDTIVRLVLMDAGGLPLLDATLPAGSLAGKDGAWRLRSEAEGEVHGIVKASFDAGADDSIRVRFRVRTADLLEAASAQSLSLALLFGDEPGVAPCARSDVLACVRGTNRLRCAPAQE